MINAILKLVQLALLFLCVFGAIFFFQAAISTSATIVSKAVLCLLGAGCVFAVWGVTRIRF